MFIDQVVIAIIFRLFNFGLIIALAAYGFKNYVLPGVLLLIAKKESEKEFLLSQQVLLQQHQSELDNHIKQDMIRGEQLRMKVDTWKRITQEEYCTHKKQNLIKEAELEKKYTQTIEYQKKILLQSFVANKVVSNLQLSLTKHFDNENSGVQYLEDIIEFMNERAL
jgi:hypothetical protein